MQTASLISSKTKRKFSFEFFGKYKFTLNFSNLLSEIPSFSNLKAHRNKMHDQNPLKPFLSHSGDQNIKSQEALG